MEPARIAEQVLTQQNTAQSARGRALPVWLASTRKSLAHLRRTNACPVLQGHTLLLWGLPAKGTTVLLVLQANTQVRVAPRKPVHAYCAWLASTRKLQQLTQTARARIALLASIRRSPALITLTSVQTVRLAPGQTRWAQIPPKLASHARQEPGQA